MPSTPVRVIVIVPERQFTRDDGSTGTEPGFWCCGRFFPNGETECILEDDPPGPAFTFYNFDTRQAETVRNAGLTVAQKLLQLEHAKGGQEIVIPDGNKIRKLKTPMLLTFKVLGEVKSEVPAHVAAGQNQAAKDQRAAK
jgi:hypothetical protein